MTDKITTRLVQFFAGIMILLGAATLSAGTSQAHDRYSYYSAPYAAGHTGHHRHHGHGYYYHYTNRPRGVRVRARHARAHVRSRKRVTVRAPGTRVKVRRRGIRIRAPYVNLYIPR